MILIQHFNSKLKEIIKIENAAKGYEYSHTYIC